MQQMYSQGSGFNTGGSGRMPGSTGPSGRARGTNPGVAATVAPSFQATQRPQPTADLMLTVFEGDRKTREIPLLSFNKPRITFGRASGNDLVLATAEIVSRSHGFFQFNQGVWSIYDTNSTNGIKVNGVRCPAASLAPGDIITIGQIGRPNDSVIMIVGYASMRWKSIALDPSRPFRIGRLPDNDLVLSSPVVSGYHAALAFNAQGQCFVQDLDSYNGTYVMGQAIRGSRQIVPGDIVSIALTAMVFTGASLLYSSESRGVDVVARDLVQVRGKGKKSRVTTDHVSLHIKRGEFVAIVGGSGSGKSTLLNELNGSDPAVEGSVFVDGIDLYPNYNYLKKAIGYVPQQDIVYDNLKLIDMLRYAAELRMPPDFSKEERERRALEVIAQLKLTGEKDNYIGRLSGGQKKRASIAVELLADPRLLFLDEPTSGLDPGIERDLMGELAKMAEDGRTIVLVTHTTLNLHLCSQVVFLGPGGKLCYAGSPQGALEFFGVDDFVPIYDMVQSNAEGYAAKFAQMNAGARDAPAPGGEQIAPKKGPSFFSQLSTLTRRYAKLIINDRQRLLLLLLQAPVLAALICLVAGGECFKICEDTQSCLFALSCAAFWVGILNSIQEVCKERTILRREYAGGLRISTYLLSKVLVLGVLCIVQSAMLTVVFCAMSGLPPVEPLFFNSGLELFITMTLLTLSAMCMGLWISTLFSNPDRAIAMAPILIMPQVLFSGLIFKLEGVAQTISAVVNCRWAMEAFGATSNLNGLDLKIYGEEVKVPASTHHVDEATVDVPDTTTEYMGQTIDVEGGPTVVKDFDVDVPEQTRTIDGNMFEHEPDDAYVHMLPHLLFDWGILVLFCVVCMALSGITLAMSLRKP